MNRIFYNHVKNAESGLGIGWLTFAITVLFATLLSFMIWGEARQDLTEVFSFLLLQDFRNIPVFLVVTLLAMALAGSCYYVVKFIEGLSQRPWICAGVTFVLAAATAPFVYRRYPVSMDEYAAQFQAKIFAAGRLSAQYPPEWLSRLVPPQFQDVFLTVSPETGIVASTYWPGFAIIMAPFALLDVIWLCNPVMTALTVPALMYTTKLLYPEMPKAAGWTLAFTIASPVFLVTGISFYAMSSLLLANLIFTWGFFHPRPANLFWSGVVGSIALTLHNPLPHLLFASPWLIWLLIRHGSLWNLVALAVGYLPLTLILGIGWFIFRSSLSIPNVIGDPAEGVWSELTRIMHIFVLPESSVLFMRAAGAAKLWLWAMPSLIVLAIAGSRSRYSNPQVTLFMLSAVFTFVGYFFVPFDQGHGWGYRYFHSAWAVLPLLGAGFMCRSENKAKRPFAAAIVLVSLAVLLPVYLISTGLFVSRVVDQLPEPDPGKQLKLIFVYPSRGFVADLVQNDPFLRPNHLFLLGGDPNTDREIALAISKDAIPVANTNVASVWLFPLSTPNVANILAKIKPDTLTYGEKNLNR